MGCCSSIRYQRPQLELETPSALTVRFHALLLVYQLTYLAGWRANPWRSRPHPECAGNVQEEEEAPAPGDLPQDVPSPPGGTTHTDEIEEMLAKVANDKVGIRATDVALGLRRVPAGFTPWYTTVALNGEPKINVRQPSDPTVTVCLEVYASFELHPMLGAGEQLRELTITVEELLDCSAKDVPFTFLPMDGDVVSPCSSILVTAKYWRSESQDSSASKVFAPHSSTTESLNELEDATNQGHRALSRYRKHGQKQDLERSIEQFESALNVCLLDHPCIAVARSNLAMAKFILCQVEGNNTSLDTPLGLYRNALTARPVDNLDRPSTLRQLAAVHFARFGSEGDEVERARTKALLHEAIELSTTDSHENRAATFMLQLHASRRADPVRAHGQPSAEEDLAAITLLEELVRCGSISDYRYTVVLGNLGSALRYRFNRIGELSDLEDAISRQRDAVELTPHGHPHRPGRLNNLGNSIRARFQRLGEPNDLEDAISIQRDAVELTPHGHPHRPGLLNNLGISFLTRFQRVGELSDLEEAISRQRDAVELTPHGHPDKPSYLHNLGFSFVARFERVGELNDLEDAISTQRDAVELTPHGHPDKPCYLHKLGISFLTRFERVGEVSDLEDAISRHREAVELTPHGHPHKPSYLHNLSNSLVTRFQRVGKVSDLEDAISSLRDAVELTPHGHPDKPGYLNNLGNTLVTRFECGGEISDLKEAISRQRDAVELTPHGHPAVLAASAPPSSLVSSASGRQRDAVELTPHGHPDKPGYLNNLSSSFLARFQCVWELSDFEDAISAQRDAVGLTPHGHPDKPVRLRNLGDSFRARFDRLGVQSDVEQAIFLYSYAATAPTGPISSRFHASRKWISCARHIRHHSLLDACSVAITLLPQLAWIGLSLTGRYRELTHGADVVREAAAAALDLGFPETAVEWLEHGRSIVWGELSQLRNSYDELSSAYPDHARRLRELSAALEHAGTLREKSLSALLEPAQSSAHHAIRSLKVEADSHRALAIERDKLLHQIRGFSGFERFLLLHKEFSRLRASVHSGPVVILNAAEIRSDALVVLADVDRVIHVTLPNFTFERSTFLQTMMRKLLGHSRDIHPDDRKGKLVASPHNVHTWNPETQGGDSWEFLLSNLWRGVVRPVLNALAFKTPGDPSRIFWCPTGPFMFLPIHGAGVATELTHIREVVGDPPSAHITLVESFDGTVEEVLGLMKEADWVHFACHGIQDAANPTNSGLCLADRRRLKLGDIIALSRPHGGLAFLSACQTAMGYEYLSDEAIHITAGMLFAGYGAVIGTMWKISDEIAPDVAKDVYGQLFRNGTWPDYREAALALHEAIGRVRHSNASFVEWLPFIHVGL
ncbi:TPR-like protein [Boletus coccyginus]|nr:TPR-like protein [Boletus coccyginus]